MADITFKYKTGYVCKFDVPYYIANSLVELLESIEDMKDDKDGKVFYKESEEEE